MNYEFVAKVINEYVKKPKSLLQEDSLNKIELKSNEFIIIQNVLFKYKTDTLTIGTIPESYWG